VWNIVDCIGFSQAIVWKAHGEAAAFSGAQTHRGQVGDFTGLTRCSAPDHLRFESLKLAFFSCQLGERLLALTCSFSRLPLNGKHGAAAARNNAWWRDRLHCHEQTSGIFYLCAALVPLVDLYENSNCQGIFIKLHSKQNLWFFIVSIFGTFRRSIHLEAKLFSDNIRCSNLDYPRYIFFSLKRFS